VVRRYAAIEKVYVSNTRSQTQGALQDAILKVYERILEFEARALCQCHHSIAFQTFKNIFGGTSWKDKLVSISDADTECTKLLPTLDAESQSNYSQQLSQILSTQTDQIQKSLQASEILIENLLAEVRGARNDQRDWEEEKVKRECMSMLRTTDFEFSKNKNPQRSPRTCEWFLQHPEYQRWLKQTSTPCLWLTADPGCGKSVLSRYLVDDYIEITSGNANICYFFFKAGEENESANSALCALLHQLFDQNEHLLIKHGIPEYRKGGRLANFFEPLWKMFVTVCRDSDAGQVICVLDALDECAMSHRRIIATRLGEFCASTVGDVNFRILITSRPDTALQNAFARGSKSNATMIRLSGESESEVAAITKEINLVIDEEIEEFKATRERSMIHDDLHNALRQEIDKIDNRTYLWVSLIFPELQDNANCKELELLRIFKTLPRTVEDAYEGILKRSTNVERARKLLSIIMAAVRPLTLTELKIAFSIDSNGNYEKLDIIQQASSSLPRATAIRPMEAPFQESIRKLCGLFVRITESRVYLIHQTAQEYLLKPQNKSDTDQVGWRHSFKATDSHSLLARCCIWYLKLPQIDEPWLKQRNGRWRPSGLSLIEFTSQYPFVDYAATHWTTHFNASSASETDEISAAATTLCSTETDRFRTWYKIYWSSFHRSSPRTYTDLLVAASFDLEQVIYILLHRGENVGQVDDDGDTALHSAAIHMHERAAVALIKSGAPINVMAKDGNTPLHSAAARGSEPIVKLLLLHGAEVQSCNKEGRTPLHRAAQFGHTETVRALIHAGASVNALDSDNRSPLHLAALAGEGYIKATEGIPLAHFKHTIEVLAQEGANLTLVDREGRTAMQLAKQEDLQYMFAVYK